MPATPSSRSQVGHETIELPHGKEQQPESPEIYSPQYLAMKRSRKDKRRAKNRVASRSRRHNRK